MKFLKIAVTLLFALVASVFLSAPKVYMQSFLDGLTVWAYNVLPALFPFAVLTLLAIKFFPTPKCSLCKLLFGVRADSLYMVSLLCGYPIGAKAVAESSFDSQTATRICSFCSSASPVFVVATVGTKLLGDTRACLVLAVVHLLSTAVNGVVFRKRCDTEYVASTPFTAADIGNTVTSGVLSVLSVGGLIALFYMLTDMIKNLLPQAVSSSLATGFMLGLLEMTNGIICICKGADLATATVLCSFLLAFGGMCVFAQSVAYLAEKKVNIGKFLLMKLSQASIATLLAFVLTKLFL